MASCSKIGRKSKGIPVVVCEFHQDVIQFIHRYIAKKKLPFAGIKMIHFDSHPDLAFPNQLIAEDCFDKEIIYNDLDIADWILPLMYEGHLENLVWVKPPFASQIDDLETSFCVGKDSDSGKLRVTCTEDYFLEDGIFIPKNKLVEIKKVYFEVTTTKGLIQKSHDLKIKRQHNSCEVNVTNKQLVSKTDENVTDNESLNNDTQFLCYQNCNIKNSSSTNVERSNNQNIIGKRECSTNSNGKHNKKMKLTQTLLPSSLNEQYILDIDLDFFSVMNPFLQDYSETEYKQLKEIYKINLPTDKSNDEELEKFVNESQCKMNSLKETIKQFAKYSDDNSNKEQFITCHQEFVKVLKEIKENRKGQEIDWDLIHSAGMTTELPHHISSDEEINDLLNDMEKLLKLLPPPAMITIARSAIDEYCPPNQVDSIEERVILMLGNVYKDIDVHYDYKDTSRMY